MKNIKKHSVHSGFTLVELMIVVVIVAILASIAFPSYQESIAKSKRAEAAAALTALAGAMERHMTETESYCDAGGAGGSKSCGVAGTEDTGTPSIYPGQVPSDATNANYNLTISAVGATSYTLQATRTGSMAADRCGDLTLNSFGEKAMKAGTFETGLTWEDCW